MEIEVNIEEFLRNIESYAKKAQYDYSYYSTLDELRKMRISTMIGKLQPEHMNPILSFLREWMPLGWRIWFANQADQRQIGVELCQNTNRLEHDFAELHKTALLNLKPEMHSDAAKRIFQRISDLKLAVSQEAIATVTSKIIHLFNQEVFVMCDTNIIHFYDFKPDADGYDGFLMHMSGRAKRLQPYMSRIDECAEKIRRKSCKIYGEQICCKKTLAKLIDEDNWVKTRRNKTTK